jgi:hypothetical protein
MKVIVVYESLWGNTAAIAKAIAEGLGEGTLLLSTAEASPEAIAGADLLVVGAPVLGFSVPSDGMLKSVSSTQDRDPVKPDLSQPSMATWLKSLPTGSGRSAAFETRIWWSPGGSTGGIQKALRKAGYQSLVKPGRFIVKGKYGPLRDGEVEKARDWGAALAEVMKQ